MEMEMEMEMDEVYSKMLMSGPASTGIKYLETDIYSISVELKREDNHMWIEIKQFMVHRPYRGQGYGKALAKRLYDSDINFKVISVLSPVLSHILKSTGWKQELGTYNFVSKRPWL